MKRSTAPLHRRHSMRPGLQSHFRGPEQASGAAGALASEPFEAPAPLSRAVGFTRYIILLVVGSVLFVAISICLVAPVLTLGNLWNVAQEGVGGSLAGHEGILRVLDLVIVMLEVVTFYLVGIGLYHLFIGPLPLAERIGLDTLNKLESKVVSVIVVMMAVIFLEHLVLGHSPIDSLLFGAAIALVVSALASFQRQVG